MRRWRQFLTFAILPAAVLAGALLGYCQRTSDRTSRALLLLGAGGMGGPPGRHLRGANLPNINLAGRDLSCDFLTDANLNGANLSDTNLTHADLTGATLCDATLARANLHGAHLAGANLQRSILWTAHLEEADLQGADLQGAILDHADLHGALYDRATRWSAGFDPRAHGAVLVAMRTDGVPR
jgi:uncharacterized protein YjbI with pentapeptide repeats